MNTKYFVKTRNFYCRKWVKRLLELAPSNRGDFYEDGDAKLYVETASPVRAYDSAAINLFGEFANTNFQGDGHHVN